MTHGDATRVLTLAATSDPPDVLIVLLHGIGGDAASFHEVARALGPSFPRAELVTPDAFHRFDQAEAGRQWFSVAGITPALRGARVREAGAQVSAWIDLELDRRELGRDRVVIVGFSQGAIVGSWLAVHRQPPPLAVVMLSGRVGDDQAPVPDTVATPVFWAHGCEDAVLPVADAESGSKILEAWGARVTTRTYPGVGHTIDAREIADAATFLRPLVNRG